MLASDSAPLPTTLSSTSPISSEPLWLPAGLLAALVMLAMALSAFGDQPTQLQWRPRGSSVNRAGVNAKPAPVVTKRVDRHVQLVQFLQPANGPMLGAARVDGLVETTGGTPTRIAQEPQLDDELKKQLETPFGGAEELPPQQPPADITPIEPPADLTEEPPMLPSDEDAELMEEPSDDEEMMEEETTEPSPGDNSPPLTQPRTQRDPFEDAPLSAPPTVGAGANPDADKMEKERQYVAGKCEEARTALKANTIDKVQLNISITGVEGKDFPYECTLDDGTLFEPRCWPQVTYMWKASALCHKPLYFEEEALERYGHSCTPCLQPFVTGAHFFLTIPVLPYCMGITPPNECVYALGHYRPGSCAPYMIDPIPFTWRAAIFQAGATVGVAGILP